MSPRTIVTEMSETQQRQIEEKSLQRTSELKAIFQAFPDLYFRLDSDGTILDYNVGNISYLYVPPEVFLGKRVQDILPPNVGQQFHEAIIQVLKTNSLVSIEYSLPMPNREQTYEARLLPFREKQIIAIVRDITDRKKAEEEIKKLNEDLKLHTTELEAVNKELEAFSYSVSHDLRIPLLVIDGLSRVLLEKHSSHLDAKGQQFLNLIRAKVQNMWQLINNLITFSRLGRQEIKSSIINMGELAKAVFEELRLTDPRQAPLLSIKTLQPARGDQAMIRQVFVNLLSNAIKFTRPKETPVIEIGGRVEENENIYYVKDNGVGFDMQHSNKLFNVFQRFHSTEEFEGTGIGLAIVQRIIHKHGGQVRAEGEVNKGATFYFTLPREK
jgi:PAS domain S-box-containing protein